MHTTLWQVCTLAGNLCDQRPDPETREAAPMPSPRTAHPLSPGCSGRRDLDGAHSLPFPVGPPPYTGTSLTDNCMCVLLAFKWALEGFCRTSCLTTGTELQLCPRAESADSHSVSPSRGVNSCFCHMCFVSRTK